MFPLGVEPVLSNWKVGVVTASPSSRTLLRLTLVVEEFTGRTAKSTLVQFYYSFVINIGFNIKSMISKINFSLCFYSSIFQFIIKEQIKIRMIEIVKW